MEDTTRSGFSKLKNKYVIFLAACVLLGVFGAAYIVCGLQYEKSRKDILEAQANTMQSWVTGTVDAINLWTRALEEQAQRISANEQYRMFAADVESAGAAAAAKINSSDAGDPTLPEGAAGLVEQVPYMRNLLLDFMNFNGLNDIRIMNSKGQTLLSALSRPAPVTAGQRRAVEKVMHEKRFVFGPVYGAPSGLVIDYADLLRGMLDDEETTAPAAALLLNRGVTGRLAQFMARELHQADAMRPRLVQIIDGKYEELLVQASEPSPLAPDRLHLATGGDLPFGRRLALTGDESVYSYGQPVPQLGWLCVLEIPADIVDNRLRAQGLMIYGIGALISIGVVLAIALLWWVMVGQEQKAAARRFEQLYRVIKQQKQLLDSVNVSLEVGLMMADTGGQIQICNRAFAEIVGRDEDALPGMSLTLLLNNQNSATMLEGIRRVVAAREADTIEITHADEKGMRLFRVTLFPFEDKDGGEAKAGAVGIFQDITEFRRASERRRQQQVNTISALVRAIESVDPYLKGHSQRMSALATLVSTQMGLASKDRDTICMAAELSQMGKLFVPRDLLTKSGQLTPEEQVEIMRAPDYAYNVLRDIDFGLPVAKAVYEMNERMDGKGYPQHLSGQEITVHARVLAVLNAFCAMVSPRSYRSGMPISAAVDRLRGDTSVDQVVVAALEQVLHTDEGLRIATPMDAVQS